MRPVLAQLRLILSIIAVAVGLSSISQTQAAPEAPGIVTTVAGNGTGGYSGDGGPAVAASLSASGVHIDEAGNLLIAAGSRIRKVDKNGIISTIAGPGNAGEIGDGGPATNAYLGSARDVISDHQGNIYIASYEGHRVRKIDPSGIITTVAGTGTAGFGGDGGPATQAMLNKPERLAVDSDGNVLIADYDNDRIRKVSTDGTITTVAGNGYTSSNCWHQGRDDPSQCGDGGPATEAPLSVSGVGVDASGNIYISDWYHIRIRMVSTNGIITTVAGNGGWHPWELAGAAFCSSNSGLGTLGPLSSPMGIDVDGFGNVYWADWGGLLSCVHKLSAGILSTVAGHSYNCPNWDDVVNCVLMAPKEDGYPALYTTLQYVRDVALSPEGDLYFAESGKVRKVPGGAAPGSP